LLDRFGGRCQLINCRQGFALLPYVDVEVAADFFSLLSALLCSSGILLLGMGRLPDQRLHEPTLKDLAKEHGLRLMRNAERIQKWSKT
jgi:hypothetical protein